MKREPQLSYKQLRQILCLTISKNIYGEPDGNQINADKEVMIDCNKIVAKAFGDFTDS
ncbi:hypothetical protein DSECCO2_603280 [anaerobic digester metagenome]|jgi:hypothetical protein